MFVPMPKSLSVSSTMNFAFGHPRSLLRYIPKRAQYRWPLVVCARKSTTVQCDSTIPTSVPAILAEV